MESQPAATTFDFAFVSFLLLWCVCLLGCADGKIRGVNLGGWLVMEPWITPKIFEAVSVGDLLDVIIVRK